MTPARRRLMTITTLVLALAATAALAAPSAPAKGGFYKGKAGLYPMSFHVSANGKEITAFKLAFEITACGPPGGAVAPSYAFPVMRVVHGGFSGEYKNSKNKKDVFSIKVSMKFSGRNASGKGTFTEKITSLPTCAEKFTITAKAQ
jgi:hypothetical protein